MNSLENKIMTSSLYVFITLVVMNSIKFISFITTVGSIGKFLFCLIFLISILLFTEKKSIKVKFFLKKEWIILVSSIIIFAFIYLFKYKSSENLLANLAYPVYFLFYFYITKILLINKAKSPLNISLTKYEMLAIFKKTLFYNFIFWFLLAIVSRINMFEEGGGFGGFFQDEIHFGFYVVTAFLISLYFYDNKIKKDRSYFNISLLFLYGGIALFTSRNASLIIVVTLVYHFAISKIQKRFYRIISFFLFIAFLFAGLFFIDISDEQLIKISSGRYSIWILAVEEIIEQGYFMIGNGLFNLNGFILSTNQGIGFYYLDSLDNLSFHSSYIEMLAAGGLVALGCFLIMIFKTWNRLEKVEKGIVLGILTGACFESFLVQPFMLIAILFNLIFITNNMFLKVKKVNIRDTNILNTKIKTH